MSGTAPRDMREWMRHVERRLAASNGIPRKLIDQIIKVREDQEIIDNRTPAAPIELTYQTAYYLDPRGQQQGRFLLDFPDVVKATDGTDITVDSYELWGRDETVPILNLTTDAVPGLAAPGLTTPGLASTPDNLSLTAQIKPWKMITTSAQSYFRAEGFERGSVWRFRARAIGENTKRPGLWSAEVQVQIVADGTPPPQPTAPTVKADRGTLTVTWDGQAVTGAMPADFKYAILAHGTESSPVAEIARFGRVGGFKVVADLPYYDPQHFRLQAVDETGNVSPWSEQATGYITPLVDTDIILSTIDAAKTHLKNIDAGVSILPDTIITEHLVVTEDMTAALAQFLHVKAGMLEANEIWSDELWTGLADAKLFRGDAFEGKTFTGGTFTGGTFQTHVEEYAGVRLNGDGLEAFSPGGTRTFDVDSGTGMVTMVGKLYTSVEGEPGIAIVPPAQSWDGSDMGIWFAENSHYLPGGVTGGMWMPTPTGGTPQKLALRGANNAGVSVWNGLTLTGNNTTITTSGAEIALSSDGDVMLDAGAGNTVNLMNNGSAYSMTSSSAANVYMHSTGQLFKSTSSLRYKTDVQDWAPGYAALELRPRSWVDRNPTDPLQPLKRYYGFIAEEVEPILPELVTYNEHEEPDAIQYERFAAAMVPILKDLHERVTALEGA